MTAVATDYDSLLESINNEINRVAERDRPLLKRHLDLSNPVASWKHEWVDKNLVGFSTTLKTALTSSTTTVVTLASGTNNPVRIIDNVSHLLMGSELMLVVSTITVISNESKYCVDRAERSTTASSQVVDTEVIILDDREEGFSAGRDDSQKGVRRENYSVIVNAELKLSGSSIAFDTAGMENTLAAQRQDLIPEVLKKLEFQLLYGHRYKNGTDETDRSSGGFLAWASIINTDNNEDMSGAAFSKNTFEQVIEDYINRGGDPMKLKLITSVNQQRQINELKSDRVLQSQSEKNLDDMVEVYNFGNKAKIRIEYHPNIRKNEAYFYQEDKVKVRPIKGRQLFTKKLPEDGDFVREMVCGEYVFEFHNADKLLFRKHNLATI